MLHFSDGSYTNVKFFLRMLHFLVEMCLFSMKIGDFRLKTGQIGRIIS